MAILDIWPGKNTSEEIADLVALRVQFYSGQILPLGIKLKYPNFPCCEAGNLQLGFQIID